MWYLERWNIYQTKHIIVTFEFNEEQYLDGSICVPAEFLAVWNRYSTNREVRIRNPNEEYSVRAGGNSSKGEGMAYI